MAKTAVINVRTEPRTKDEAEQLFSRLGLTVAEAVNLFLHQAILTRGVPFAISEPAMPYVSMNDGGETLRKAVEAYRNGVPGVDMAECRKRLDAAKARGANARV
ncbi:MAG: type II toxin-antitoxin system RelB/DinJ family antitoxin [Oscillospiraceae bacterium]|nr:type II toxin-antitoxin system RelB/DinJ family antitoxin [Oscillospiraceae bacterium]